MRRSSSFLLAHLQNIPDTYSISVATTSPGLLYLLNKNRIFPLHRSALKKSIFYETKFADEENKFLIIDEEIENSAVEKVLKSLYGESLTFERNWEILSIFKLLDLLGIKQITESIIQDTLINYNEYSFFVLFNFSLHFSLSSLLEKCLDELILEGFDQLDYNKYDLFLCDLESLRKIIEIYNESSQYEDEFISRAKLIKIVKWYCKQNEVTKESEDELVLLASEPSVPCRPMSVHESSISEKDKKENILKSTMSSWNRKLIDSGKGLTVVHGSHKPQTVMYSDLNEESCEEEIENDGNFNKSKKSLTSSQIVEPERKEKGDKVKGKRFSCMTPSSSSSYFDYNIKVNKKGFQ